MKLPWVSREELIRVEEQLRVCYEQGTADVSAEQWRTREAIERAEKRYDALLEKYQALLDRVLPVPSLPVKATAGTEPRKPDPIQQAIRDESAGDSRLAAHLRKRANELLAEKKTREEVAQELRTWQTTATEGLTAP